MIDFPILEHARIKVTIQQVYNESGTKVIESEDGAVSEEIYIQ
jgi:hypothetical protein